MNYKVTDFSKLYNILFLVQNREESLEAKKEEKIETEEEVRRAASVLLGDGVVANRGLRTT